LIAIPEHSASRVHSHINAIGGEHAEEGHDKLVPVGCFNIDPAAVDYDFGNGIGGWPGHDGRGAVAVIEPDPHAQITSRYAPDLLARFIYNVARAVGDNYLSGNGCAKDLAVAGFGGREEVSRPDDAVAHAFLRAVGDYVVDQQETPKLYNSEQEHKEEDTHEGEFHHALSTYGARKPSGKSG
jgi:hypothetical protein